MRRWLFLALVVFITFEQFVCAADEPDYFAKIAELAKKGTAYANPELEQYLKSLTRDQMLTAARQYCRTYEKKVTRDLWGPACGGVGLCLVYFPEKTGSLSDESLDKVIACISDPKEGEFFRYAIAQVPQKHIMDMTEGQRQRLAEAYVSVLRDREAPASVRIHCGVGANRCVSEAYRVIVYADAGVKELSRTGTNEQRRNLASLVASGEIKLNAKTMKQLDAWKPRIRELRQTLVALDDKQEPADLKKWSKGAL